MGPTVAGWLLGMGTTAAVAGSHHLVFGVHSRSAHLVLDTVDACVALLVTFLLWGRFRRSLRLQDLLLAQGLLLLAAASVLPGALDAVLDLGAPGTTEVWWAIVIRVTASTLVIASALVGRDRRLARNARLHELAPVLVLAAAFVALWWVRDSLPLALPLDPPASASRPVVTGHPLLLAAQAAGAVAFGAASLVFAAQASRRRDVLLLWMAPACGVAAFARVNYFLFPSLYTDWVYTGDLLRSAAYALMLVGAAREIGEYWTGWATAAVLEDRRRLARELHDGVVQELGYIRSTTVLAVPDEDARADLLSACDRAIDEARAAVDALGRSAEEPLGFVLHRAARQVAERYGGRVLVDLDDSIEVGHAQRHALVRITREAVSNAIRHGTARSVTIRLERDAGRRRLVVRDDGRGIEPAVVAVSTGYGLTSMRERAAALPGAFEITSADGQGTAVTVVW
ncbi:sensor histidine kinase [Nocardioides koreensis]|uniref:sensor histidine kinase n=1 Tax=Nocardioides koreensis TaxID=433651 RepID=UPI0031DD2E06